MIENKNNNVFLRPRFELFVEVSSMELKDVFQLGLGSMDCKFPSRISENHFFIDISEEEAHFWSPQLALEIVEDENNKTVLKGLFGPKPKVWTLFMFFHLIGIVIFIISLVVLYVRWSLKGDIFFPMAMVVVTPVIWFGLYFLGRLGRKKGKKQIEELHDFMMEIVGSVSG